MFASQCSLQSKAYSRFTQQISWFIVSPTIADIQAAGTSSCASIPHRDPSVSTATQLESIASFLLHWSLQPSSIPTYQRAWKLFHHFYNSVFQHPCLALPISPSVMALFISYLYNCSYAPSTVNTYISALGYCHKLMGLSDPSKVFYVSQILKGHGKVGFRLDSRLPITLPILNRRMDDCPAKLILRSRAVLLSLVCLFHYIFIVITMSAVSMGSCLSWFVLFNWFRLSTVCFW